MAGREYVEFRATRKEVIKLGQLAVRAAFGEENAFFGMEQDRLALSVWRGRPMRLLIRRIGEDTWSLLSPPAISHLQPWRGWYQTAEDLVLVAELEIVRALTYQERVSEVIK